jgi:nucleoside-diphosphate-sugar epimerase
MLKDWRFLRDFQHGPNEICRGYQVRRGFRMAIFVVVGAGPVGRETARILAAQGHEVRVVSRGGQAPQGPRITGIALDARDGEGLARVSQGAAQIFMCAMAPYTRWPTDFPPIMEGVVAAAEKVEARLIVLGNIYGYGRGAHSSLTSAQALAPTSVKGQVRAAMWKQALNASVPALEVRASDYLGEDAGSLFTLIALPSLLAGKSIALPGDLDTVHPWSFTKDVARTLVAATRYQGDWGRAFHVPSQHATVRDIAVRFAELAGAPAPDLRSLSDEELASDDDLMREIAEMAYLFEDPCILEASESEQLLGVSASSLDAMIRDTLKMA